MSSLEAHSSFMKLAIQEALKGEGQTYPNPIVGALIVEGGEVVSKGHHEKAGEPHAEVNALLNLDRPPEEDAVMYVTLEPCSTEGQTGACTDVIIQAGIKFVVIGAIDPNPMHQGRGVEILRHAGVEVVAGILGDECEILNPDFNQRMKSI